MHITAPGFRNAAFPAGVLGDFPVSFRLRAERMPGRLGRLRTMRMSAKPASAQCGTLVAFEARHILLWPIRIASSSG